MNLSKPKKYKFNLILIRFYFDMNHFLKNFEKDILTQLNNSMNVIEICSGLI